MPEFLAETYTPHEVPDTAAPRAGDLARAAAHASRPGTPVRFLGAIAVPAEVRGWRNRASGCGERFTKEERTS